jgi:hypothetical protein
MHTDGLIDAQNVEAFIRGYQALVPLSIGELWAVPALLRLVLVERLADLASELVVTRTQFSAADDWADRIIAQAEALPRQPGADLRVPAELQQWAAAGARSGGWPAKQQPGPGTSSGNRNSRASASPAFSPTFVGRFQQRLREAGSELTPILAWLDGVAARSGFTTLQALSADLDRQALLQAAIRNTIRRKPNIAAFNRKVPYCVVLLLARS